MTDFRIDNLASFGLANSSAFVASAGLVLDSVSGTRVTGHIDLGPQHHTPWGVVHGGAYTTAVETAASIGASVAVHDRGQFAVGVHNSTDFITASTDGRADVVAEPLQQGRVQQLWLLVITRTDGRTIARGQVRLQNVPLPTSRHARKSGSSQATVTPQRGTPNMTQRISEHRSLSYQTFITDPIPVNTTDRVPNGDRRRFSPMTTTLITGARDAVLIDPPMTIDQTKRVGDWIEGTGKHLIHIYLTHGHGDHWFGTAPLLRRFPEATALATPGTIEMMHLHGSTEFRAAIWDQQFPGPIPDSPVLATPPTDNRFELEWA
jgi:1,4-dihydroxy-2-naphthoyl-CoA hydrolase